MNPPVHRQLGNLDRNAELTEQLEHSTKILRTVHDPAPSFVPNVHLKADEVDRQSASNDVLRNLVFLRLGSPFPRPIVNVLIEAHSQLAFDHPVDVLERFVEAIFDDHSFVNVSVFFPRRLVDNMPSVYLAVVSDRNLIDPPLPKRHVIVLVNLGRLNPRRLEPFVMIPVQAMTERFQ